MKLKTFLLSIMLAASAFSSSHAAVYNLRLHGGMNVTVQVCQSNIFRIRVFQGKQPEESLMERYHIVKTDWSDVASKIKTDGDLTVVSTADYKLRVNRRSGEFSVVDSRGATVISKFFYRSGKDSLCAGLGNSINEKFLNLHVNTNNGIIGDDKKKFSVHDKVETGDFKKNSILSFSIGKDECFYGGGSTSREHINHRGELLRMWTTYQHTENPQPFMMSTAGWAVFNNTTLKHFFDVGRYHADELNIYNTSSEADFYVMLSPKLPELINDYTLITGRPYLLPRYAYGLCFGPNMLENQFDILRDGTQMRNLDMPCDLMWLEPQWMEKRYDFSTEKQWNYDRFSPEPYWTHNSFPKKEYPQLFIGTLHEMGYHLGLWLCIENDFSIDEEDALAKAQGRAQSGKTHWADHLMNFVDQGVDGFKLDPARTIDEHPDTSYYNGRTDREMHNLNQVLMPKNISQTFAKHTGRRPWLHYCGGWAGTQHWAAANSGDNGGTITALFDQVNLGLSGFLNTSCDIMSTDDRSKIMPSLHFGMFLPWSQINSWFSYKHPFYFNKHNQDIYRAYVQLRYALNPYIYSTAIEGALTGMPIDRAMVLEFPKDKNVSDMAYQFMFGPSLLVGAFSDKIYLPAGEWMDYWTGERLTGGRTITHAVPSNRAGLLFMRQGAIIPMMKKVDYIGSEPLDTLILKVWPKGESSYTLLEDDGISYKFRDGAVASTRFDCSERQGSVSITVQPVKGSYDGMYKTRTYELQVLLDRKPTTVSVDGVGQKNWTYDSKGVLRFTAHQPSVSSPLRIVIR